MQRTSQFAIGICAGCLFSVPAQARELFELSLRDLMDTPITSASKSEDTLADIPNSVTIVQRDDIALMGYDSLAELLMNLPGVYHIDSYEDFLIGMRGVVGGSFAFLINGVQQHPSRIKGLTLPDRSRINIPIDSIDRIEFVRGPSSVIYGNNAFLGSINVITNDAGRANGKVVGAYGGNGYNKGFLRLTKELDAGEVVFNLGADRTYGIGGSIDDLTSPEQQDALEANYPQYNHDLDGTLSQDNANLDISARLSNFTLGARYSDMRYGFYPVVPAHRLGTKLKLTNWDVHAQYDYSLSEVVDGSLTGIVSELNYHTEPDFTTLDNEGYQKQGSKRYELEGLVRARGWLGARWVGGINYRQLSSIESDVDIQISADGARYQDLRQSSDVDNVSGFANVNFPLTESVTLVAGYRLSSISNYQLRVRENRMSALSYEVNVDSRDDRAAKLATIFNLNEAHSIRLSYSTGTQDNRSWVLFDPEKITSLEASYAYLQGAWSVNSAFFWNETENLLRTFQTVVSGRFVPSLVNDGEWSTRGAELIVKYRPKSAFFADFSTVVQRTKDEALAESVDIGNSPHVIAKLQSGYGYADWRISGSMIYVDEMLADYQIHSDDQSVYRKGDKVAGYFLLNANIRYQKSGEKWYLNFHAFNFLNDDIRYPANELVNFQYGSYGPEQRVSFGVGVDF
ncbi:TonB-dependent receptor plug domain-containing protein [Teredinibacter turnerae]|uniref:TonB-dependent receptor plug domain-containing protein n=1 Tax=Teredinibacter turnerae TaxID=2426 RepID=UPI001E331E2E|nr:TonB-dependent receptor [Teredinibacter turnerae]